MNAIITPKQMSEYILKLLDDVTKDIPAENREKAKANILNSFSGQMFNMGMREKETK